MANGELSHDPWNFWNTGGLLYLQIPYSWVHLSTIWVPQPSTPTGGKGSLRRGVELRSWKHDFRFHRETGSDIFNANMALGGLGKLSRALTCLTWIVIRSYWGKVRRVFWTLCEHAVMGIGWTVHVKGDLACILGNGMEFLATVVKSNSNMLHIAGTPRQWQLKSPRLLTHGIFMSMTAFV